MNLKDLKAFVCVADKGSFSLAAEEIYLTQSAVSKRVAALESSLDTKLLDRIGHKVILTEAGRLFIPKARSILADIEDSYHTVKNLNAKPSGRLRVTTSYHLDMELLRPILQQYCQKYPEVELDLSFIGSQGAYPAVEEGQIDLGVIALLNPPTDVIPAIPLWKEELAFVISKEHELVKKNQLNPASLADYPAIPVEAIFTPPVITEIFSRFNLTPKMTMQNDYFQAIIHLVAIGLGWSIIPKHMVTEHHHVFKIPDVSIVRSLGVIYDGRRTLSSAATALLEMLQNNKDNDNT